MKGSEARKYLDENADRIQEAYDSAKPVALANDAEPIRRVARGFAQFREYINRKGRPKSIDRKVKVSIRLPETYVLSLREMNGYSRMLGDYIVNGIVSKQIHIPQMQEIE
jgi:hypothetical protein